MPISLLSDLRSTLDAWPSGSSAEEGERREWLALASDPALLDRSGTPAHFTASALPVDPDTGRVCLVLHPRIGAWVQPGGHLESEDATVVDAAAREMEEETGLGGKLDPVPLQLSRHPAPCGTGEWHLDLQMLAIVPAGTRPRVSPESLDVAWFAFDALPSDIASGVEGLVAAARGRLSRSGTPGPPSPAV